MKFQCVLILSLLVGNVLSAQYVYTINADSVKITNHCDTAELILENHTQNVPGFLFNKGRGRTEFRRALQQLNPTTYLIGGDTLFTSGNAWVQGGNTFGTTGILGTRDSNHLDFYTNNNYHARLTATGELLLGTTLNSFGNKLVVNGTAWFANGLLLDHGAPYDSRIFTGGTLQLQGNAGTGPQIYMHNQIGASFTGNTVVSIGTGSSTLPYTTQDVLEVTGNTYTPVAFFKANGNVWLAPGTDSGNVLIGTTTDNKSKLQVNGSSYFNGAQQITGNISGLNPVHTTYNPVISSVTGASAFSSVTGLKITPALNLGGDNQLAYAMDIAPTYNLNGYTQYTDGISPALHISATLGGIRIDQNATYAGNSGQPLYLYQGAASDKEEIVNYRNATPTLRPFIWNIDNRPAETRGSMVSVIRSSLTPNGVMAGAGISYSLDRYYYAADASIDMKYELAPVSNIDSTLKSAIAFNTVDMGYRSAAIYISGSKIGLGTTTPAAQLHTTGSVRFAGLTSDSTQTRVLVSDANGNLYYRNISSWAVNNTVNSSLTVNGAVNAQSVSLKPARWADYVFDKTYHLPSLSEVEACIRKSHHLPGIPSAGEVAKKGIDMGESQAAVLQKIEELTLYAIEQERKIQQQNNELASLKQQVAELKELVEKINAISGNR